MKRHNEVFATLATEKTGISNEMYVGRVTNLLRDLYATVGRSVASDSDLGASLDPEARKHEPYI